MRFGRVCVEGFFAHLPDEIVTSAEIESRLKPVYDRLGLPEGRLELMTGIRERRFFPPGTKPGSISAETARVALERTGVPAAKIGCLIHASVCRDQLEPATASLVHHRAGLPQACQVFDVSNACLGLLNGALLIAQWIEAGVIEAGLVVGTEDGRGLVEGTIDSLLADPATSRNDVKLAFASLTIGSASAAILLTSESLSRTGHRLLGGVCRADTSAHELCAGGVAAEHGDDRPRMKTDSEALLHAGVDLAGRTWDDFRRELEWSNERVDKAFTHQVGRAHRKLLYERLGLDPALDFATVEWLGNTGAAALPATAAIGVERGHLAPGDHVALLGIGSGLNSVMLGLRWGGAG
jgi:3-oxoacyl-[acyl-carrier-protein] synthase III